MYDYNLTAQEISDYNADMLELMGEFLAPPTEEQMELMAAWCEASSHTPHRECGYMPHCSPSINQSNNL